MRSTFTSEFIYDAAPGWEQRGKKMATVLGIKFLPKNILGQLSGVLKCSDGSETETRQWIEEIVTQLVPITIVPFKIVWLLECGDVIIKEVASTK